MVFHFTSATTHSLMLSCLNFYFALIVVFHFHFRRLIEHFSHLHKLAESESYSMSLYFAAFGEAFITTFRTFISPLDLIEKLIHRYTTFCCQVNDQKQKAAKESFSLLVRVVNDLT